METSIMPGGVYRCSAGGIDRLVLVLGVNRLRSIAQVTLVHPYMEWATDADVIIDTPAGGYPLVIQTDLRSIVWLKDLGSRCAAAIEVPSEVVNACLDPLAVIPAGMATGSTLRGALDARWAFKEQERQDLSTLSEDCIVAALAE